MSSGRAGSATGTGHCGVLPRVFCLAFTLGAGVAWCAPPHLTAVQQRILAEPGVEPPDARFSFEAPAGPVFSEAEKALQREAAKKVLPMVREAFDAGAASVRIPPGHYRFGHERWDRDGVVHALEFKGLRREAEQTFTIDASGATFWFDLPDDQAPTAHFCVGFKECANIVFRGATLDRGTRGHVEGRITRFDFAGNRIEIELSPGLTIPAEFNDKTEQRLLPFKADGSFCAPLYALQRGGTRLKYRSIERGSAPGRVWVVMREPDLLATIRDPAWEKAFGEQGVLRVGDGLSCVYSVTCAIELERCRNMTMEGLRVYIPKGGNAEWGGDGGHLWKNCDFGPRPGTSQWQGGDGFMFCATRRGTTLDHVTICHSTDDTANIHGYWGHIKEVRGNRVGFEMKGEFRRTVWRDVVPGDRLVFRDKAGGDILGETILKKIDGETAVVDRDVGAFADSIVEWPDHSCAGWTIRNCRWRDNYQRLLIQSGPGTLHDCVLERHGSAIELNSVMPYVEGGVPRDIAIRDNRFESVNPVPGGATIVVYCRTFGSGMPWLRGVTITGNTFVRPGGAAIELTSVTDAEISRNRFVELFAAAPLAGTVGPEKRQAVRLGRCAAVRLDGNVLTGSSQAAAGDVTRGSAVVGCDEACSGITLDGKTLR